jgi:selenocysteine lyase/cysteine desulfurase
MDLMPRTIYFDYNATTPLDPAVRDAMLPFLGEVWGNPSSVHHVGRKARALLDDARDRAAKFLGAKPSEIIFTSGGTEATISPSSARRVCSSRKENISSLRHRASRGAAIASIIWKKMKVLRSRGCRWIRKAAFRRTI